MDNRAYPKFPIPGVGAIVVGPRGILLVRRFREPAKGLWSIPGGAIEVGELQEDTVIREVQEETGVDVRVVKLVGTYDVILHVSSGVIEFHYLLNHYLTYALTEDTRQENPEAEVSWFHPDSLPIEEMPPPILTLIESEIQQIRRLMKESP